MAEAYPLSWPVHRPRTKAENRERANFHKKDKSLNSYTTKKKLSVSDAVSRLYKELGAYTKTGQSFRVPEESIVISSNLKLRLDGLPLSNQRQPEDPGVAVYFTLDDKPYCLPCDKWDRVEDNIAAVASHVAAMRGIERWGVGEAHDVYTGFKAIAERASGPSCWDVLNIEPTKNKADIDKAYKQLVKNCHPDKQTGSLDKFHELQSAREAAHNYANGIGA